MNIVEDFPHPVRHIEHCWIPLSDGCRLAARIWLPADAEQSPVPAIIEYIPYRKRDGTRLRDEPMHRYFAGHGYAAIRIDLRGSGESEGLLLDEYLEQEQEDGVEVIQWVAGQSWCTGAIGMMGKSWGGFNALQVAARRPAPLKAIITVCSTDDRYADDAHYMGGCLLNENLTWGAFFLSLNALAPDPAIVGNRWREMWLERLENTPLFPAIWLRHQHRDAYWQQGSVCEDFSRIGCAVYAIGGWADGYTNAVPRLLAGLRSPRKGLVGPWAHVYPHEGSPGPAIGFLQEAIRWWDYWLKGARNNIMAEPAYRVWMQDSVRGKPAYDERPGRWVAEPGWPSPNIQWISYGFTPQGLSLTDKIPHQAEDEACIRSPQTVGLAAGSWCSFGADGEMPIDQREDDGKSITVDSEILDQQLDILGAPVVHLEVQSNRSQAFVAVRLNDVFPDGSSTRITYGLLNLTHRDGHEHPEALKPGRSYSIRIQLNDVAYSVPAGHRLRIALSTAYWPLAWPSPISATLTMSLGGCLLEVPVRPASPLDLELLPFAPPEAAAPPPLIDIHPGGVKRTVERHITTGETVYTTALDFDETGEPALTRWEEIGLDVGHSIEEKFFIKENDPLSARAEIRHRTIAKRGGWSTHVDTFIRFYASIEHFHLEAVLEAFEGSSCIYSKSWNEVIARDNV